MAPPTSYDLRKKLMDVQSEQGRPEYNQLNGTGIHDKYGSSYIPTLIETAQDDIGQLLDRQNRVYFVTTIGCISVIIFAVMINSKR